MAFFQELSHEISNWILQVEADGLWLVIATLLTAMLLACVRGQKTDVRRQKTKIRKQKTYFRICTPGF